MLCGKIKKILFSNEMDVFIQAVEFLEGAQQLRAFILSDMFT